MTSSLEKMNENVAGIDVGSRHFFVGVDSEDGKGEVKILKPTLKDVMNYYHICSKKILRK